MVNLDMIGSISDDFVKNLKKLRSLNLAYNNLQGELPDIIEWTELKDLERIELNNNNFTGRIPLWFERSFENLEYIFI